MSYDHQQNRSSRPPIYSEGEPGAMENELYIDGILYVDGVPIIKEKEQKHLRKQIQQQDNQCKNILLLIRSNYLF